MSDHIIKVSGNSIYFYDDVNQSSAAQLVEELSNLQKDVLLDRLINKTNAKIWLHINSDGGGLFEGFAIAEETSTSLVFIICNGV